MEMFRLISRHISISFFFILVTVFSQTSIRSQLFAQQLPGEVLQQMERDRQQQELLKKQEEQKKPPVIIEEKKEPQKGPVTAAAKILVKKFKVEGNTLISTKEINSIVAPFEGKELTLEELRNVGDLVTARYRDKGYIIANAFIPKQVIKENVVKIEIIEGKIEDISVTGNKSYSTSFIENRLAVIREDPSLKEQSLEKAILLLNDYPSLNVTTALKAGKEPGTTDVIATVTDKFPISGSVFYDNYGTSTTGRDRVGLGLNIGNLLTSGDGLNLWGLTGVDTIDLDRLSYGRAEYNVPLGVYGTRAGFYYAHNLYEAVGVVAPLGLSGKADVAGVYVTHPLIKTRDTTLSARLGFDYKDVNEYALEEVIAKDRVRVATFGLNYDSTDRYLGKNFANVTYYQGISDFLGGNGSNDVDISRVGAAGNFNKVTAEAIRIQGLPGGYNHLILRGFGQYSSDPLLVVEQFLLGGAGSVRGFNPAQQTGDTGYTLTAEAVVSPFFADSTIYNQKVGNTIQFAFFVDEGYVRKNNPQPGDTQQAYLTGTGAGLRLYAGKIVSVKVDYGIPRLNGNFEVNKGMTYVQTIINF